MTTMTPHEPPLDVFRLGSTYHALLDLPGVDADHVRVRLAGSPAPKTAAEPAIPTVWRGSHCAERVAATSAERADVR